MAKNMWAIYMNHHISFFISLRVAITCNMIPFIDYKYFTIQTIGQSFCYNRTGKSGAYN